MVPKDRGRQELEEYWRISMWHAHAVCLQASAQYMRMQEELGYGLVELPDGSLAVARARRAQALARYEYARAMRTYRMVLTGQDPPQEEEDEALLI